ncbi:MAG TPA: exo-alpha-sialidase [Verrucomicrobiales bacterium]|nr:exo-alpha-sialidase [Verrucomicrobiales bacterium]
MALRCRMFRFACLFLFLPLFSAAEILPPGWDARAAADKVMAGLVNTTEPQVKGAHDAEMAIVGDHAYIVAEANDVQGGESAEWPFVYVTLAVVNVKTLRVEKSVCFARSEQKFDNVTLPAGACFVPRILQKGARTLRCYFASESPKQRQAQTWFLDYDLTQGCFENTLHKAKIKTTAGTFDMQPQYFHQDAAVQGFTKPAVDFGLYLFDSFKVFDGQTYVALNNYPGGQNALARVNASLDVFEVVGHYNEPGNLKLTESAVNRLPDGTWMAICRQEGGNRNYTFTTSRDGRTWSPNEHRAFVPNGTSSKPTFDRLKGLYYLGWQDAAQINGASRSVFNLDVSKDGVTWERKYRFETEKSFQYPVFRENEGRIYLSVTQGDKDASRKERIMFGILE